LDRFYNSSSFGQHELIVERKARKKIKEKVIIIIMFFICILSLFLFLNAPFFTIKEITIVGLDRLYPEEVYDVMLIREGMNIWKISPPELKEQILALPRVQEVDINRVLPDKLFIKIKEKYPLALVPYHGYYLELAPDGMFIGIKDEYEGELPLINGLLWGRMDVGMQIPDRARKEVIELFLEGLRNNPSLPLAEINVENLQQIIVYTWEGLEVRLGSSENLTNKLEILQHINQLLILEEHDPLSGYLDLRVPEAPVFIPVEK